jgi:protein-glutamine gamma-glutamyltransferase
MLRIAGRILRPESAIVAYPPGTIERTIFDILDGSNEIYSYPSFDYLNFEIDLRISIIKASRDLYRSGLYFRNFRKAFCNEAFWKITSNGGFLLREDVKPSHAVQDIFDNGSLYGTECATAIVILFYKGILDVYKADFFDKIFPVIKLLNWHYLDSDIDINSHEYLADYLPGDCRYFKNPEVNPKTPEWRGENAIDLADGTYYGHGIGIKTAEGIISTLNRQRKEGAVESAYLLDMATRPNFRKLAFIYLNYN